MYLHNDNSSLETINAFPVWNTTRYKNYKMKKMGHTPFHHPKQYNNYPTDNLGEAESEISKEFI